MIETYIGLGSNLGRPQENICRAGELIDKLPQTRLVRLSTLYKNPPMSALPDRMQRLSRRTVARQVGRQPEYVNAVARVETALPAMQLLNRLQGIEKRLGRIRTGKRWIARMLDLDLLLYGEQEIALPRLQVPHYGILERAFVLVPMAEIASSGLRIPGAGLLGNFARHDFAAGLEKLGRCPD
jgi:2-amino-4-hydroxy-6-hydroxymethyldihydropteridine diphosphokinase